MGRKIDMRTSCYKSFQDLVFNSYKFIIIFLTFTTRMIKVCMIPTELQPTEQVL